LKTDWNIYYHDISKLDIYGEKIKIMGDLFESLVGAVFLDCGFDYELTRTFVLRLIEKRFLLHWISPN
jgi:dsRNA-specific ribonuclease